MRRLLVTALVVAAAASACSDASRPTLTDDTLAERRCSADGMTVPELQSDGIPSPVAARRQELIDAAVNCDYRKPSRLARDNHVDIRIEGETVPVAQWREREHDAQPILRPLAGILALEQVRRDGDRGEEFVWPNAVDWPFADVADERDRQALLEAVGEAGIFGWREAGGYAGWRTSIGADGTWQTFWYGPVDGEYDR
jgi:hypothetical protein